MRLVGLSFHAGEMEARSIDYWDEMIAYSAALELEPRSVCCPRQPMNIYPYQTVVFFIVR